MAGIQDDKLHWKEKAGYGFGDFASSMFWKLFTVYLLFYYTDVFGLTAAAAGTLFLVTRIWDTVFDPLIGVLADRTNTRWGKFRPYLLWMALPFGVAGILTFTAPDITAGGKLVYAYTTYTLMMMVYSAINVPYASLMGVMTLNSRERTALSTFRFVFAFAGSLVVLAATEPLVSFFSITGSGINRQRGWQLTAVVLAIIASLFFYLTFALTKERVQPAKAQNTLLRTDIADLLQNKPWLVLLGAAVATLLFNSLRDGAAIFYFRYFFAEQRAVQLPLADLAISYSTLYLVLGQAANIIGVLLAKPLSDTIGKKKTFLYAMLLAAVLSALVVTLGEGDTVAIFLLQFAISVCAGSIFPLLWAMYADIADHSEYKTGRRATGLIFSSSSMAQKLGWTLGGAFTGWLLSSWGFEANVAQTAEAKQGIRMMVSLVPAAGALLSAVFILFYQLNEEHMAQVSRALTERRKMPESNGETVL